MDTKRVFASILSTLIIASSFAGCSEKPDESPDTDKTTASHGSDTESTADAESSEAAAEEERIKPDIPETADYGGDEIRFLYWTFPDWSATVRESRDIYSDGLTGEGLNDAVYNRNLKIEGAYKVKIALEKMHCSSIGGAIGKNIKSGDGLYDFAVPRIAEIPGMVMGGMLLNMHDAPNLDFTKPWYDKNCVDEYTVGGKLHCIASSLIVNDKDCTAGVAFNKDIARALDLGDMYALANEGTWTFDKVSELSEKALRDTDGDGDITVDDVYGFLGGRGVMESFYYGADERIVESNDAGELVMTIGMTERSVDALEAVVTLMQQKWFMNHHLIDNTDDTYYRELFETGHGLFYWMRLDDITDMRAGDADFGVLPTPKYSEEQSAYRNLVSKHTGGLLVIPKSTAGEQLDRATVVLEALTAESHYTLIPEYIESSLKSKVARDSESGPMIEIIINNRVFDPGYLYDFGEISSWLLYLGDKDTTGTIASGAQKREKLVNKAIGKFMSTLEKE